MNEIFNESKEFSTKQTLEKLKNEVKQANKPGIVNYLKESKDGKYNIYSYKLIQGGTKGGIKNKYEAQIGPRIEGTQFTDANGNKLKKERFEAGEIVYLRVPKKGKETLNSIPEMTLNEIMKISDKEIIKLYEDMQYDYHNGHSQPTSKIQSRGGYMIMRGKKIYMDGTHELPKTRKHKDGPILTDTGEGTALAAISIAKKVGNNYMGVSYNGKDKVYRGELEWESGRGCFVPKEKGQDWY